MRRFLFVWITCTVSLIVTSLGVSLLGFRRLDLRLEAIVALTVLPAVQALVLSATTSRRGAHVVPQALAAAWRHPLTRPALVFDGFAIMAGLVADMGRWPSPSVAVLSARWLGVKAGVAAAILCAPVFVPRMTSATHRRSDRPWFVAMSVVMLAVAVGSLDASMAFLPDDMLHALRPRWPTVLRWAGLYATLFALFLGVGLRTAAAVGRRSAAAEVLIECALGCVGLALLIVVPNIYLRPEVTGALRAFALASASMAASFMLVGTCLGLSAAVEPPETRGTT